MGSRWVAADKKAKLKAGLEAGKSVSELSRELGLSRNYIYGFRRQKTAAPKVAVGVTNTVFRDSIAENENLKMELKLKNEVILDLLSQIIILKNANIKA